MSASARYLEAAKVEELARELRAAGYRVTTDLKDGDAVYDLVASNGERTFAVEVKARSALQGAAKQIRTLRERAKINGFDDFRLVIVNPPRERAVEVEGLDTLLFEHLTKYPPGELQGLSAHTRVDGVGQLDIGAIKVARGSIRVGGTGVVAVALENRGGEARKGAGWDTEFPIDFDLLLNPQGQIEEVYELTVDTAGFQE
jgi:hypothetical protein